MDIKWDPSMYRSGDEYNPNSPFYKFDDEVPEDAYEQYMEMAAEERALIIDDANGRYFCDHCDVMFDEIKKYSVKNFDEGVKWFEENREPNSIMAWYEDTNTVAIINIVDENIDWDEIISIKSSYAAFISIITERAKEIAADRFDPVAAAKEAEDEAKIDRYIDRMEEETYRDYYR